MTKFTIKSANLDDAGSIFATNALTYLQTQVYEYRYAALQAFDLFPVNTSAPAGAEYISYMAYQGVGRARVFESYADDLPAVDLQGFHVFQKIVSIGDSYRYSIQEIRASQLAGISLPDQKAIVARRAIDQEVNRLAFQGQGSLQGFLNNPAVPIYTVPADGTGASTLWSTKTPDQILRDMNAVVNQVIINSNGVEQPDTLLLPIDQYTYISTTARSTLSDTTILQFFLLNNPSIKRVIQVPYLTGAGPTGLNVMVAYDMSREKLVMEMPLPFTQHAPQERNLEFVVNCECRFGGISIFYPLSVNIAQGI